MACRAGKMQLGRVSRPKLVRASYTFPSRGMTGGGIEGGAGLRRRLWANIMVLYHQLGASLWPGLRRQPQPAPQSPTSQVQPQPAQAQPKHADPPAPFAVGERPR